MPATIYRPGSLWRVSVYQRPVPCNTGADRVEMVWRLPMDLARPCVRLVCIRRSRSTLCEGVANVRLAACAGSDVAVILR